jgi:hypothetical protein
VGQSRTRNGTSAGEVGWLQLHGVGLTGLEKEERRKKKKKRQRVREMKKRQTNTHLVNPLYPFPSPTTYDYSILCMYLVIERMSSHQGHFVKKQSFQPH